MKNIEDSPANPVKAFSRKLIFGLRLSNIFRFYCLIIAIHVFIGLVFCFYYIRHYWIRKEEYSSVEVSKEIELQLAVPSLIKPGEKINYESIFDEELQNMPTLEESDSLEHENTINNEDIKANEILGSHFGASFVQDKIKNILGCFNKKHKYQILTRNDYWILKNFYRAGHGQIDCYSSVTYATHGDYTQLGTLPEIIRRWDGPISLALYAPGKDFYLTLEALKYLLNCLPESPILRLYLSVHIYFDANFIPFGVWKHHSYSLKFSKNVICPKMPLYYNTSEEFLYKTYAGLLYPVNVARNIAREAALTHFVLDADLDMYPSMGLSTKFLDMIAENGGNVLRSKRPRIFALPVFGVKSATKLPELAADLRKQIKDNKTFFLDDTICYKCNTFFNLSEWINQTRRISLSQGPIKRIDMNKHSEPFYIGTNYEPFYHERFSREGFKDRTSQAYLLCTLNYDIYLLNEAFLLRKEGNQSSDKQTPWRKNLMKQTENYLTEVLYPSLIKLYGQRKGCSIMENFKG